MSITITTPTISSTHVIDVYGSDFDVANPEDPVVRLCIMGEGGSDTEASTDLDSVSAHTTASQRSLAT